jgi:RRXRR protein/HNH endonuclease
VFVLDRNGVPLQPCRPARARQLLKAGRAVVAHHTPFVIRLKDRAAADSTVAGVEIGVDPGSKFTGIALFTEAEGEKWHRACAYCGAKNVPLNLDHIVPRARGGSNRASNLALACIACNQAKGGCLVEVFLAGRPLVLAKVLRQAKVSLRDAAAVSATRWALWRALTGTGFPVEVATGGRTTWNRQRTGAPKTHTLDALHVGVLPAVTGWPSPVMVATSTGRGGYARTRSDRYGFPRLRLPRVKTVHGYATGDLVRAVVPSGVTSGTHVGRVAVRSTGKFNIRTAAGLVQGIHHRHVQLLQRADGWAYTTQQEGTPVHCIQFLPAQKDRVSLDSFR